MDRRTASQFVARIQDHRRREEAIWDEMRQHPDYEMHEDKTIAEILDALKKVGELNDDIETGLSAFDWVDDGTGNFVPREEVEA